MQAHSLVGLDLRAIVDEYRTRGFVIVEDLVSTEALDAALRALTRHRGSDRYNASKKIDLRKLPNLATRDEVFRRLACDPNIARIVDELLGQGALIFRDVMVVKPAHEGAHLDYHQDSAYWDVEPKALVSAWIPLSDITMQNGCLRIIEGSHRMDVPHDIFLSESVALPTFLFRLLRRAVSLAGTGDSDASGLAAFRKVKNALLAGMTKHVSGFARLQDLRARIPRGQADAGRDLPVKRGSVIFFHSRLLHASGRNETAADRCAYIVSYMGEQYLFTGVGQPHLLVASEPDRPLYKAARTTSALPPR